MTSIFALVDPGHLRQVSRVVFNTSLAYSVGQAFKTFPKSPCPNLQSILQELVTGVVPDIPEVWAWTRSIKIASAAFSGEREDVGAEALIHLRLDSNDATRIADLLRFQAVGILTGSAVVTKSHFSFETVAKGPPFIAIPSVGRIDFLRENEGLSVHVTPDQVLITTGEETLKLPLEGAFQSPGSVASMVFSPDRAFKLAGLTRHVPIHDPALFQPTFQSLPQVSGYAAISDFIERVSAAGVWIEHLNLRQSTDILRWSTAFIGLASFGSRYGSASRQEALGLVYLPVNATLPEMAECLLHESLHQHLFRLDLASPLFLEESDNRERYFSPWRSDPRPLIMALHGAFVFTGVAALYSRCVEICDPAIAPDLAHTVVYKRTREALAALDVVEKYGHLTRVGRKVVARARRHASELLADVALPLAARRDVDTALEAHRTACQAYLA